jgi:hypothetical protein
MKLFYSEGKVNFVDENNVFVGYDLNQQCCEKAFYVVLDYLPKKIDITLYSNVDENNLDDYRFKTNIPSHNDCSDIRHVVFNAYNINNHKNIYIILCNVHNGYYAHGFIMHDNNKIIVEGDL